MLLEEKAGVETHVAIQEEQERIAPRAAGRARALVVQLIEWLATTKPDLRTPPAVALPVAG